MFLENSFMHTNYLQGGGQNSTGETPFAFHQQFYGYQNSNNISLYGENLPEKSMNAYPPQFPNFTYYDTSDITSSYNGNISFPGHTLPTQNQEYFETNYYGDINATQQSGKLTSFNINNTAWWQDQRNFIEYNESYNLNAEYQQIQTFNEGVIPTSKSLEILRNEKSVINTSFAGRKNIGRKRNFFSNEKLPPHTSAPSCGQCNMEKSETNIYVVENPSINVSSGKNVQSKFDAYQLVENHSRANNLPDLNNKKENCKKNPRISFKINNLKKKLLKTNTTIERMVVHPNIETVSYKGDALQNKKKNIQTPFKKTQNIFIEKNLKESALFENTDSKQQYLDEDKISFYKKKELVNDTKAYGKPLYGNSKQKKIDTSSLLDTINSLEDSQIKDKIPPNKKPLSGNNKTSGKSENKILEQIKFQQSLMSVKNPEVQFKNTEDITSYWTTESGAQETQNNVFHPKKFQESSLMSDINPNKFLIEPKIPYHTERESFTKKIQNNSFRRRKFEQNELMDGRTSKEKSVIEDEISSLRKTESGTETQNEILKQKKVEESFYGNTNPAGFQMKDKVLPYGKPETRENQNHVSKRRKFQENEQMSNITPDKFDIEAKTPYVETESFTREIRNDFLRRRKFKECPSKDIKNSNEESQVKDKISGLKTTVNDAITRSERFDKNSLMEKVNHEEKLEIKDKIWSYKKTVLVSNETPYEETQNNFPDQIRFRESSLMDPGNPKEYESQNEIPSFREIEPVYNYKNPKDTINAILKRKQIQKSLLMNDENPKERNKYDASSYSKEECMTKEYQTNIHKPTEFGESAILDSRSSREEREITNKIASYSKTESERRETQNDILGQKKFMVSPVINKSRESKEESKTEHEVLPYTKKKPETRKITSDHFVVKKSEENLSMSAKNSKDVFRIDSVINFIKKKPGTLETLNDLESEKKEHQLIDSINPKEKSKIKDKISFFKKTESQARKTQNDISKSKKVEEKSTTAVTNSKEESTTIDEILTNIKKEPETEEPECDLYTTKNFDESSSMSVRNSKEVKSQNDSFTSSKSNETRLIDGVSPKEKSQIEDKISFLKKTESQARKTQNDISKSKKIEEKSTTAVTNSKEESKSIDEILANIKKEPETEEPECNLYTTKTFDENSSMSVKNSKDVFQIDDVIKFIKKEPGTMETLKLKSEKKEPGIMETLKLKSDKKEPGTMETLKLESEKKEYKLINSINPKEKSQIEDKISFFNKTESQAKVIQYDISKSKKIEEKSTMAVRNSIEKSKTIDEIRTYIKKEPETEEPESDPKEKSQIENKIPFLKKTESQAKVTQNDTSKSKKIEDDSINAVRNSKEESVPKDETLVSIKKEPETSETQADIFMTKKIEVSHLSHIKRPTEKSEIIKVIPSYKKTSQYSPGAAQKLLENQKLQTSKNISSSKDMETSNKEVYRQKSKLSSALHEKDREKTNQLHQRKQDIPSESFQKETGPKTNTSSRIVNNENTDEENIIITYNKNEKSLKNFRPEEKFIAPQKNTPCKANVIVSPKRITTDKNSKTNTSFQSEDIVETHVVQKSNVSLENKDSFSSNQEEIIIEMGKNIKPQEKPVDNNVNKKICCQEHKAKRQREENYSKDVTFEEKSKRNINAKKVSSSRNNAENNSEISLIYESIVKHSHKRPYRQSCASSKAKELNEKNAKSSKSTNIDVPSNDTTPQTDDFEAEIAELYSQKSTKSYINMAIVREGYPDKKLTQAQMQEIQAALMDLIDKTSGEGPQFRGHKGETGALTILCVDEKAKNWLQQNIEALSPWQGEIPLVVDECKNIVSSYIMYVKVPPDFNNMTVGEVLQRIEKQNSYLNTTTWKVIGSKMEPSGQSFEVFLPKKDGDLLREQLFTLYFGLSQIKMRLIKKLC